MTCHVLIIEDEPITALDLEAIFQKHGGTSFSFADTEIEAVAAATARRPDLIASDVNLREGTGPGAVHRILEQMGPLPVIFITATPGDCRPCVGQARVLSKPVQEASIVAAIHAIAPFCEPGYQG